MDDLEQMPASTRGYLLRALDAACNVHHRGELFLWCQGPLHALVPHGVLVCMQLDAYQGVRHHDCLHALPLDEAVLSQLRDPHHGVMAQVALHARRHGEGSVALEPSVHAQGSDEHQLAAAVRGLGLDGGVMHCTGPLVDSAGFVAVLLQTGSTPVPLQQQVLRLLAPQLHLAFLRSLAFGSTRQEQGAEVVRDIGLTQRQLEILHWVKLGKTNHETALILSVSELTVKNHLQRVFKKLNVHNRAQAVARLMAINLE